MVDRLEEHLARIKEYSDSLKRRAKLYSDVARMSDTHIERSLGSLQKVPAPGKKLQKIGFIMLFIPEPTGVTCAVGGPMILAGRYLDKKYNSATITDVGNQTKNVASTIRDFKGSIT